MNSIPLSQLRARFTPLAQSRVPVTEIATGLMFDCPCERCAAAPKRQPLWVPLTNPIDPGNLLADTTWQPPARSWHRSGDTVENITLTPSVDFSSSGHWHGNIIDGKAVS